MTDELKTALADYAQKLLRLMEDGAVFAGEQIPLVIQEKLTYDLTVSVILGLVGLILLTGGPVLIRHLWQLGWAEVKSPTKNPHYFKHDPTDTGYGVSAIILFGVVSILGNVLFWVNLLTTIKILIAPRLYIIDWLRGGL